MTVLTDAQQRAYWTDGFLFPVDVAEPADVVCWYETFKALQQDHANSWNNGDLDSLRQWLRPIVSRDTIRAPVETLLGAPIAIQNVDLFLKQPSTSFRFWGRNRHFNVKPHVDTHFEPAVAARKLTVWLPLCDAHPKHGGLHYIRGSHRTLPDALSLRPDNVEIPPAVLRKLPSTTFTPVHMAAGQMAIHHSRTIHASGLNRGQHDRIAIAIRYETAPTADRQTSRNLSPHFEVSWRIIQR